MKVKPVYFEQKRHFSYEAATGKNSLEYTTTLKPRLRMILLRLQGFPEIYWGPLPAKNRESCSRISGLVLLQVPFETPAAG